MNAMGVFVFQEESGTTEDGAQERFIGPLPREGSIGCTHDYVSQSYSYSSVLSKSETGILFSLVKAMLVCNYFSTLSNSSTSRVFFNKLQFILKIPTSLLHFLFMFFMVFSHPFRNGRTVFHPFLTWDRVILTLSGCSFAVLVCYSSLVHSQGWISSAQLQLCSLPAEGGLDTLLLEGLLPHLCLA